MATSPIVFLHGFASSNRATKAKYLRDHIQPLPGTEFHAINFNPTPTDFEYLTVTGMINRLRQYVIDQNLEPIQIIGSSLGALVGLNYAHRFGGVDRLMLVAPLLYWSSIFGTDRMRERWKEEGTVPIAHYAFAGSLPLRYDFEIDGQFYQEPPPPPAPILIVHGRNDETVPIDDSRRYAEAHGDQVRLVELDANHDMNDSLDVLWEHVEEFLLD